MINKTYAGGFDMQGKSRDPIRTSKSISRKRQLEAAAILDMVSSYGEHAFNCVDAWGIYLVKGMGSRAAIDFHMFDDWLSYRYEDAALPFVSSCTMDI